MRSSTQRKDKQYNGKEKGQKDKKSSQNSTQN